MISTPNICFNPTFDNLINRKIILLITGAVAIYLVAAFLLLTNTPFFYSFNQELNHHRHIRLIPKSINFANEEVLFPSPTAYQLFYKEFKTNAKLKSKSHSFRKQSKLYLPLIIKILKKHKIPEDFKYVAIAESCLQNDVVSPQGAAGIWQFTESTALSLGLVISDEIDERLDPEKATLAACRLIKLGKAKFGNWTLAAAAYNRGINGLERAIIKQETNSYYHLQLNKETARYLYKLVSIKILFET